jgi:hypothetical protein
MFSVLPVRVAEHVEWRDLSSAQSSSDQLSPPLHIITRPLLLGIVFTPACSPAHGGHSFDVVFKRRHMSFEM